MAAQQMLQAEKPKRRATLEFLSPTAFKSKGMTVPVPMPDLVFGSLVDRWNAFSPVVLSPEVRRFGEEMVAVSRFDMKSRSVGQKGNALRIGGVGNVTYTALGGDRYWLGTLQ
ncbi:CRISPR system precrRNA processing endoribonuclease RAMP protein Cas6, partial [Arthrospira platensis SPKY2]